MDGDLITDQPVVHSERPLEPSNSNNGFDDIEEMAWWEALRSGWEQYMLWALCFIIFRITLTFLRLSNTKYKPNMKKPCKAMFVLGSGGHTTEMFHLLTDLNYLLFSPRLYVHGSNDQLSATRAIQFEGRRKDYVLLPISRIREVHQSLLTVPFTAALPLFQAPFILLWHRPDVLVANGPGICIPLILWSFVFAVFCLKRPVIIFVESFCRVQTLSLTARFMKPFVDRLIVQWRPLHESYKKATRYHGLLV
ncbi:UDP-N-acetylglucosamine transferase subunit alg14-like isoform X1 [Varroa jacobsoni]|uniref:UDP-N-acetylglucosamine transferase subunit alg14-like isoform X1 n=2 Tax=Varroa jacobsoni TaxID=62625 RepID=UPI000BF3EE45|nr:UDP-N-acetylglucosamine transferase subunit alg14-like isoform X1 [Varroa jacobsoni]